jgi:hypothetical protein
MDEFLQANKYCFKVQLHLFTGFQNQTYIFDIIFIYFIFIQD